MSYNYDQCLSSIREHRLKAYANTAPDLDALQRSMDEFTNLSKHCPMTPLLWMQYAKDTEVLMHGLNLMDAPGGDINSNLQQLHAIQAKKEALETSTGILELGLAEFPGCALLHLYYLESLGEYFYQNEKEALHHLMKLDIEDGGSDSQTAREKLSRAFHAAWEYVGKGSHVNEGLVVTEIYRFYGSFLLASLSCEVSDSSKNNSNDMDVDDDKICNIIQQISILCTRWSKTPMGEGSNDEMIDDFKSLWDAALSLLQKANDEKHAQLLIEQKTALLKVVDDNRRNTSSMANSLSSYENDIDLAMTNEGIYFPHQLLEQQADTTTGDAKVGKYLQMIVRADSKWDSIILGKDSRYLLGLGAAETSHAFAKYASFLQRCYQSLSQKSSANNQTSLLDHITEQNYSVISCLYERAVSECPTVESLWVSYIKFLRGEWIRARDSLQPHDEELKSLANVLRTISQRSVRNCPYSSNLFELWMTTLGLISTSNLEPDDITAVVHEATQLGFLNANREAMLSIRLVAINVVKRKLLLLVSRGTTAPATNGAVARGRDYDQEDEMEFNASNRKKVKTNAIQYTSLAPTIMEEVQDLIEDIRDMYEETDNYLFKSHAKWDEGKVCYWKHRCLTEAYVLGPVALSLRKALDIDELTSPLSDAETMRCFEKLVKTQKPCHPDSWREYLRYVGTSRLHFLSDDSDERSSLPGKVGALPAQLRQVRGLYKRAMSSIRKAGKAAAADGGGFGVGKSNMFIQRDYDLALWHLCHDYVEFEQNFGSEESLSAALSLVKSKMANYDDSAVHAAAPMSLSEENVKRKLETNRSAVDDDQIPENDDQDSGNSRAKRTKVKTNLKEPKKTDSVHKVRIGKFDYPAHPFTIHVSNLSKDTQDMDLVDAFRSTGGVVHAKILREKLYGKGGHHSHGESKGCGLVQFEERMAVEDAIAQNGELEIGGKLVKISRSHLPAVGVVPQGMHRVNPKGEGKMSKRNQLKKKSAPHADEDVDMEAIDGGTVESKASKPKNKYRTSSSPGSIKLDSLSFRPRAIKPKPKMSLGDSAK